jgi:hypothetical protein
MSGVTVPAALRLRIAEQSRERCGYCLTSAVVSGTRLEIDHLIPIARGGPTEEWNLWLACSDCNDRKCDQMYAVDPESKRSVKLFNPRLQSWNRHFAWAQNGTLIVGRTATGRDTVEALRLNRSHLVRSREVWVRCGLHPPSDI